MAVAAGVIDVALRAAGVALAKLAPEGGGAAMLDGAQRAVLHRAQPVRRAEGGAVRTDDVGELAPARASRARSQDVLPSVGPCGFQKLQR